MTAADSPTPQCSVERNSRSRFAATDIAPDDWDLLFCAALEFLARVAVEKVALDGTGARLESPGNALRECLGALDQLRRSVPPHNTVVPAPESDVDH